MNQNYHQTRFTADPRRDTLWKTLWTSYFQYRVPAAGCVLDLGTGYGQFINNVVARRRIAVDVWPGSADYLQPGVECIIGDIADLSAIADGSVDFAFASNVFEHLTQPRLKLVLSALRTKLARGGTLTILQPNYKFAFREYFDDYTHVSIWSDVSLSDFLDANGFKVIEVRPRFLPLTIKSRLPVIPMLIQLYLALPYKPLAKQMLVVAQVRES